uniref:Uncharacterized protein n=1 Tax=Oryza nivara TaxID=4536 RepID=A0A0E0J7J6_ORYNI
MAAGECGGGECHHYEATKSQENADLHSELLGSWDFSSLRSWEGSSARWKKNLGKGGVQESSAHNLFDRMTSQH